MLVRLESTRREARGSSRIQGDQGGEGRDAARSSAHPLDARRPPRVPSGSPPYRRTAYVIERSRLFQAFFRVPSLGPYLYSARKRAGGHAASYQAGASLKVSLERDPPPARCRTNVDH